MNKNFALVLSCAVSILGLVSCNNKETDMLKPKDKTHTVIFKAQTPDAAETKTALHLRVVPDWRKTDVNDVHIFETETSSSGATYRSESNLVTMETPIDDNWSLARFSAAFDNASVIVTPPTKAEPTPGFKYTAIMASTLVEDDKTVKYIVPSVQYPDEVAWIDPKADMLVGSDPTIYPHYLEEDEEIGLSFKRPVALARLAITNLEGTTVSKVKITTANHITGYVTYDEINFDKNTIAEFNGDDSNKELTILYPEGKKKTTTFYAYFVCVPGTIQFSKIEVYTDLYVFTKAYATPASLTLTAGDFMNIALDMTPKDNNGVTRTGLGQQTLTFVDTNQQEVKDPIEFDLKDGKDNFVAPTLVIGDDVVDKTKVTVTSNKEEVATVEGVTVSLVGATGEATITASVPGDDTHAAGYASYKIIVTDTTAPATVTFYKAEELVKGQKYIIVSDGKAMTLDGTTLGVTAVTDVDGVIETSATLALWTAAEHVEYYSGTSAAGHYTLESGDNYLQRHSDGSTQTVAAGEVPDTKKYYVWEYDGTHLYHLSSSSTTFYMGYVDNVWKFNYETPYYTTTLYTTTKPLTKQVISFGEEAVTAKYDLNGGQWTVAVPTISGNKTDVTYSISGDESIKVNATSGEVTIENTAKKGDKATVTATAAQTDEYTSATASYTIEIIDSTPGATAVYNKVTSVDELEEDGQYLLVFEGLAGDTDGDGDPKVFNPVLSSDGNTFAKAKTSALDVNISNNTIESSDFEDYQFTLEQGYYLKANKAEKYIYPNSTTSGSSTSYTMGAENTASHALTISFSSEIAEIKSGSQYLVWSTSNHYFSCNNAVSGQYSTGICLYKLDDGRQTPTMSFSPATAEIDLADVSSFTKPALTYTGDATSITYTSSNTAVAEVSNDGTITPKKKGTVTITAKAARTDTYKAATATYTLTVVDTTPVETVTVQLKKATTLTAGQKYVLVSNGKALVRDGSTASDVVFNSTDNTITVPTIPAESYLWTLQSSTNLFKNGDYYLGIIMDKNGGSNYQYSVGLSTVTSGIDGTSGNNEKSMPNLTINVSSNYIYYTGNSSAYFMYYNTTSSKWDTYKITKANSYSHNYNTALYVVDDGTTPEPPTPSTSSTYTRISGQSGLETGTYLIVSENSNFVFTGSGNTNSGSVSSNDGNLSKSSDGKTITITGETTAYEFVFTRTGDVITVHNSSKGYLFLDRRTSAPNTYINFASTVPTDNNVKGEFTVEKPASTNSVEDAVFFYAVYNSKNQYLYYKNADSVFKIGESGAPTKDNGGVLLYKKNSSSN